MLRPRCLVSFLGLCLVISLGMRCDARAVNVSNTWTMPQEGLNVFYRFFRDRISWFEADAVCQFHHANLVTVDNSFQFDATRDLLRELDVNDIVWIGLMRPQNSDRFMWSNSRPLVADTGYWAESLPLMDAPLCAVIDPIRDYRWHALRCGGPETASFLCEMPVPSWADACILKDMPNLTMQYMADTASIELIRNCQEEGLLRHTCKGKEDREPAIRQLICPKERLEAQRINDITNSHFKSLQIINNIRTDNKENNDIDLLPNYGRRSGMAINIEVAPPVPPVSVSVPGLGELMQADAPGAVSLSGLYRIPDLVPKPVKKAAKKVITPDFAKKLQGSQQQQQQHSQQQQQQQKSRKSLVHQHEEEMMMGDQPALSEEQLPPGMDVGMHIPLNEDDSNSDASNEIFEHLPHKKKILPQDLRTMSPIVEADVPLTTAATTTLKTTTLASPATATATTTAATTTTTMAKATATTTTAEVATTPKAVDTTSSQVPTATTTRGSTTTIRTTTITTTTTTTTTPRPEETTTTTTRKPEPTTMVAPRTTKAAAAAGTSSMASTTTTTTTTSSAATPTTTTTSHATPTDNSNSNMAHPIHPSQQQQHHQQQILHEGSTLQQQHATHVNESADNTRFIPPMLLVKSHYVPPAKHASEHATTTTLAATTTGTVTTAAAAATTTSAKAESQPSAVTSSKELTAATATPATPATTAAAANAVATSTVTATTGAAVEMTTSVKVAEDTAATSATTAAAAAVIASEAPAATTIAVRPTAGNEIKSNATAATPKAAATLKATAATTTTTTTKRPVPRPVRFTKYPENVGSFKVDNNGMGSPEEEDDQDELGHLDTEAATKRHNFLEETEAPFKPNRRRSLTKPETVSYFKKILG
ncbi:uncharacterized protein [Drosophila suzukii]|uniref:C-type lectin domain-containing protein n=1 Tax=Drosophila suzukii TaxID=28584 RepID=A0AB39ZB58_DROSZ